MCSSSVNYKYANDNKVDITNVKGASDMDIKKDTCEITRIIDANTRFEF